jgi:hypothetical protein
VTETPLGAARILIGQSDRTDNMERFDMTAAHVELLPARFSVSLALGSGPSDP